MTTRMNQLFPLSVFDAFGEVRRHIALVRCSISIKIVNGEVDRMTIHGQPVPARFNGDKPPGPGQGRNSRVTLNPT